MKTKWTLLLYSIQGILGHGKLSCITMNLYKRDTLNFNMVKHWLFWKVKIQINKPGKPAIDAEIISEKYVLQVYSWPGLFETSAVFGQVSGYLLGQRSTREMLYVTKTSLFAVV